MTETRRKLWCDYNKKPWHTRDTCWKLHGKPPHIKKKNDRRVLSTQAEPFQEHSNSSKMLPFTKEQIEQLYKLLNSPHVPSTTFCALAQQGNPISFVCSSNTFSNPWVIESGATGHMTSYSLLFTSHSPSAGNRKIKIVDGSFSAIAGSGSIKISPSITLENVLHVPKLSCNLLSISQLSRDLKCKVNFYH